MEIERVAHGNAMSGVGAVNHAYTLLIIFSIVFLLEARS